MADQAYRYTRRIKVTRITGCLFVTLQRPDSATRFVIGQYHKPAPSHCVGGLFNATNETGTDVWTIPGSSKDTSSPYFYYGLNDAFVEMSAAGSQVAWPFVPCDPTLTQASTAGEFEACVTPGPFNSLLTFQTRTNDSGTAFNKQLNSNHVYGQQFNFLTGAGPDFTVLYTTTVNTLNALSDQDGDAGGNKTYQQIQFDLHPDGPITEYEVYTGVEYVGSVMGNATSAYGIASGPMPGTFRPIYGYPMSEGTLLPRTFRNFPFLNHSTCRFFQFWCHLH